MARLPWVLALLALFLNHALLVVVSKPVGTKETRSLERRYSGKGTWFIPDTGACGDVNSKSDYIVAMNYAQVSRISTSSLSALDGLLITAERLISSIRTVLHAIKLWSSRTTPTTRL
jgi:hypothetical protein